MRAPRIPRVNRRTILKGMGAAALAPALTRCTPRSPGPTSVTPALLRARVKTVVVLMMENRSFDHVFGSLSLVEGRTDVDGLTADMANPRIDGSLVAPHLADGQCIDDDPPHGFAASHEQWAEGANDGFVRIHERRYGGDLAHRPMGYLDRAMAPASYALADRYALCQRWFASVMGPTWPNRYYSLLATSDGNKGNVPIREEKTSIFSRLDSASVRWKQYFGNFPFSGLLVEHSIEQAEYDRLDRFFEDAAAGTLPAYVHLDPIYGLNDDHPPAHPLAGQILIASIYAALAQSPQWGECLFVVTYDEHGGFFDHVSPPVTEDFFADFQQMGFRVPSLVVGPWVRPQVSSTVFDHTSTIATLLRQHELEPLNERDAAANDLWGLLDEEALLDGAPADPIAIAPIDAAEEIIYAEECRGSPLHVAGGRGAAPPSGQPELEAFFRERAPGRDLLGEGPATWARILAHARDLGVVK
jgi:phospholipase C